MTFDWTISVCSSLDCTLRISWCMLRCHIHLRFWRAGLLMIDLITLLSTLILILLWLFWSLHMHTLTLVYHLAWHVYSLTCVLSWSSFEHDVRTVIHPDSCSFLCGHEWYILYSAWLYDAWLPSSCVIACCLSMWVAHLSPYLHLSWFRSFLSSRFSLLQMWDLLCACSLTELEVRSRV